MTDRSLVAAPQALPKLPERAVVPLPTRDMLAALWHVTAGLTPPVDTTGEALVMLADISRMAANADPARIVAWLMRVNLGLEKPLSPAEFSPRAQVLADALSELPSCVFTADTARDAVRHFEWFPGAAKIQEFLGWRANQLLRLRRDLQLIVDFVPPPPRPAPPTPEQLAEVRAAVAEAIRPAFQPPERTLEEQIAAILAASNDNGASV